MVLSADGAIFGTPQYMSPEQCRGTAPDPRTDIYALGCVAFELLLGEPPFSGKLAVMFASHLTKPPRVPSTVDPDAGIPPELDAIVLRCLAKPVEQRFQTGGDLCAAIQGVPGYRPLRVPHPRG
jgi:serine/threonine-protein kinase